MIEHSDWGNIKISKKIFLRSRTKMHIIDLLIVMQKKWVFIYIKIWLSETVTGEQTYNKSIHMQKKKTSKMSEGRVQTLCSTCNAKLQIQEGN